MALPFDTPNSDATLSIHAGDCEPQLGAPLNSPPNLSTSFYTHPDASGFSVNDLAQDAADFYTRWSNPTTSQLEQRLAALERGEACVTFASGMAALTSLFLDQLRAGEHVIIPQVCYAGLAELTKDTLPRLGIESTAVDMTDLQAIEDAIRPNTRLIHIETPANPILKLCDIAAIAEIAKRRKVRLAVDSTIATPIATKPLALGADFVIHSLSKYLSGHGDVIAGAVIGSRQDMLRLRQKTLIHMGGCLSPFSAWLVLRGLETLVPRMAMHESNARKIEAFLAEHPAVEQVFWPGSPRHPQHALAARQMKNFSGLLSFRVKRNSATLARQLADKLSVFAYAVSLGKTRSLLFYIPTEDILRASFRNGPEADQDYRAWAGEGVFRVSVGLEEADDLIRDLDSGLDSLAAR